jgi:uncharacterized SAM-binding protein YcdF (DUF218 family)
MKRAWWTAGAAVVCAAPILFDPPHAASRPGQKADAALVLSGDVDFLRLQHAARLRAAGLAPVLLLTGAGVGGDSAQEMRRQALALGVPEQAIVLEPLSRSTRENLAFAAPIVKRWGWHRVALVTSASHMARAARVARRVAPEVEWLPEPVADAGPQRRIVVTRLAEWAKLGWYLVRGWL